MPDIPISLACRIGALAACLSLGSGALAETVTYRFDAERLVVQVEPPAGSVTAEAAGMETLSGTFSFDPATPAVDAAGIPGQVAFAPRETGSVEIAGLQTDRLPGWFSVTVTDGITRTDDPRLTIADAVSLSSNSADKRIPVDRLSLVLRYPDAEHLQGTALPAELNLSDIAERRLIFSTQIEHPDPASEERAGRQETLGLVIFRITAIERVD